MYNKPIKMRKTSCLFVILCFFSVLIIIYYFSVLLSSYQIKQNITFGNTIVNKIEEFRAERDSLPASLIEMGLDERINGELFCYQKVDGGNYIVWFGTSLGEGMYYYSDTHTWEDRERGFENDVAQ